MILIRTIRPRGHLFSAANSLALLAAASAGAGEPEVAVLPPVAIEAPPLVEIHSYAPSSQSATLYSQADLAIGRERTVDEVLRGETGIHISKLGNGHGVVFVRGAGGHGLTTLDGLPLPDAVPALINLDAIIPDGLQQVEVNRGFGAASQPFSSLGGAIRLTTREAADTSGSVRVEGGTFGTLRETATANLAGEHGRIAVTANRSDIFDGAYFAQKAHGNPERDPSNQTQTQMRAGLDLSDSLQWDGSMYYRDSWTAWDDIGVRNNLLMLVDGKKAYFAEEDWVAQNSLKARINADWSTRLQVGYTHSRSQGYSTGANIGYQTDLYLARWENDNGLWHGDGEDALRLVWGAEGRHETAEAPTYTWAGTTLVPGAAFSQERSQQAGFVETRWKLGALSGDTGVRYEGYDRFDNHAVLHAGAAWAVLPSLTLRANGGNGFRIPSYAEMLFPLWGRRDIKPERGAGGDVGLEWRPTDKLKLNVSGFYNRFDNLIVMTWNPLRAISAQIPCAGPCLLNFANVSVAGAEASGELVLNEQWRGGVAYTYTDSRNLDNHQRVPFRPRDTARLWGEWRLPVIPLTLWAEGVYLGHAWNDYTNTVDVNDAVRVNAQANYKASPHLDLYVRGENLANDKTPQAFGFNQSGAAVYGGVALKLW
jgi:outer membrane cobalamin receptor